MKSVRCALAAVAALVAAANAGGAVLTVSQSGNDESPEANGYATLSAALTAAQTGDEIEVTCDIEPAEGFIATMPVTIRGAKADGTPVVINGAPNGVEVLLTMNSADTSTGYLIENIVFTNAVTRGVAKTGAASATFKSCVFTANGRNADADGRGGNFAGNASSSVLRFEKCLFLNNEDGHAAWTHPLGCSGMGASISNFMRVEMEDTDFIGNGMDRTIHTGVAGRENGYGAAIYASSAPIAARNVRFIGNRAVGHSQCGGIVVLTGNGDGTSFTNCLWVGNTHVVFSDGSNGENGGAVCLNFDNSSRAATFSNCTIAYNIAPGARTPGLNIRCGKAVVRNSVLYGNLMSGKCGLASEIAVRTVSSLLDIDYSLLPSLEEPYLYVPAEYQANVVVGSGMRYGDPLFATSTNAFLSLVRNVTNPSFPSTASGQCSFWFDDDLDMTTIDTHLRSIFGRWNGSEWVVDAGEDSLAIDAGDPAADCSNEPVPNGNAVNLGFYGNTAEASKSSASLANITVADVGVRFETEWTNPSFTITLGESVHYFANIYLCLGATNPSGEGTEGWDYVYHVSSAAEPGKTYTFSDTAYFGTGTTLYYRVYVGTLAKSVARDGSVTVSGRNPPAWGHGGGAEVVHLDGAARGDGSGRDWINACTTLDAALAQVTETRTNIWVSGLAYSASDAPTVSRAVTMRGGFTSVEDSLEDRGDDASDGVIDGNIICDGPHFAHASGVTTVERMTFQNTRAHGIHKTGNGDLVVRNCRFVSCGCNGSVQSNGRGIYAEGSRSDSSLEISDCVFDSVVSLNGNSQEACMGVVFYIKDFNAASVVRTRAVGCGVPWTTAAAAVPGRDNSFGIVFHVNNAPVQMRECEFVGNRTTQHTSSNAFALQGNCDGATIKNCVFAGTLGIPYGGGGVSAQNGNGLVRILMDNDSRTVTFENCTFAYNLIDYDGCAGICARKGAVRVRNSIFYGNIAKSESALGVDLYASGGTIDIDWSALSSTESPYVGTASGAENSVTLGSHIVTGDPLFATPWSEVAGQIAGGTINPPLTSGNRSYFKEDYDPTTIDVHLMSRGGRWDRAAGAWIRDRETSACICAGDPSTPTGAQAMVRKVNLGAYGGTAEASQPFRKGLVLFVR